MSEPEVAVAAPPAAEFGGAVPILRVADLDASLVYYAGALRFEPEWRAGSVASVRRGRASLMLCQGDQGHPGTWVWLGVSDADVLHEELLARGVAIRHPPTNYPWGSRELHVADPDGNVLRLGADLRPGEPYGPWLDGAGVRWLPDHEGGWRPAA